MPKSSTVIVGMGEIGSAFYKILAPTETVYGFDVDTAKCKGKPVDKCDILHICIPYHKDFADAVHSYLSQFKPQEVIIHSSVPVGTTEKIHYPVGAVAFSPFRGVHARMTLDMKRYTKYWAGQEPRLFIEQMKRCGVPVRAWEDSARSLELAKLLLDVVYYGWLIIFAQHAKVLADRFGVDDKKLWLFTEEIHKFLGNRPRMFSGEGIGGHCVMQDKNLLNDSFLDAVFSHDEYYRRNLDGR